MTTRSLIPLAQRNQWSGTEQAATTIAAISNSAGVMRNLGISCVSKIVGGPGCYHRAQETRDAGALRADKCQQSGVRTYANVRDMATPERFELLRRRRAWRGFAG